jgi:hypothetical protein
MTFPSMANAGVSTRWLRAAKAMAAPRTAVSVSRALSSCWQPMLTRFLVDQNSLHSLEAAGRAAHS